MADLIISDTRQFIDNPRPFILEIGANDGEDSARFLETYPKCWLYCFECDGRAIRKWQKRMEWYYPPYLVEVALSDTDGKELFYPSGGDPPNVQREDQRDWDKSGSLLRPTGHLQHSPWCIYKPPIPVRTMRLDTWMDYGLHAITDEIDFVWMDVQGGEAKVLRGAFKTLPKVRYLYLEVHDQSRFGPLYEGAPTLAEIEALLPGHENIGEFSENFLFRRKDLHR